MLENMENPTQVCNDSDAFVKVDYRPWNLVGLEEDKKSQKTELDKDVLINQLESETLSKKELALKDDTKVQINESLTSSIFQNPFETYMTFYSTFNKICLENWNSIAKVPVFNLYKFWN